MVNSSMPSPKATIHNPISTCNRTEPIGRVVAHYLDPRVQQEAYVSKARRKSTSTYTLRGLGYRTFRNSKEFTKNNIPPGVARHGCMWVFATTPSMFRCKTTATKSIGDQGYCNLHAKEMLAHMAKGVYGKDKAARSHKKKTSPRAE